MAAGGRRVRGTNGRPPGYSTFVHVVLWAATIVASGVVEAQSDACGSDLGASLPSPFNSSDLKCRAVWNNFVLRYTQSQEDTVIIVLSAPYTSGWIGIGFSQGGVMVGSSAMVGWISREGKAVIRQYYLGGQSSSEVKVNEGQLRASGVAPRAGLYGANIYMAFQVQLSAPIKQQSLLFAYGAATPTNYRLRQHDDKTSLVFDFSSGAQSASSYPYQLKRNHGILGIVGWGVLLPVGAVIARHCKQWDPLWYYAHVATQLVGFVIGLTGVVTGISLYDKLHANVRTHRGLGIFVFVLCILQVLAFILRPHRDSKMRRYWNWYHHWVGRLALLIAAVNIFLGIHVGNAGTAWRVGYTVNLAVILTAAAVLEILLWMRSSRRPSTSPTF